MQAFTPSPAPRRTVYERTAHEKTPPNFPRRRNPKPLVAGGKLASRFTTPVRGGSARASSAPDDVSLDEGMEIDEGAEVFERGLKFETIFAKSEELQVTFYAHLPAEVKLVLRNADFYREAYTGEVDTETGFALVASAERCFVWNYSQALTGTPTCYIFACPQDLVRLSMDTPFHILVPFGSSREPGLILMSPGGTAHFWDSLGMGLAGGEYSSKSSLGLSSEERVTKLIRADPQTYILSTSLGRLFRLVLTASGGKYRVSSHSFNRPPPTLSFSRLLPSFLATPNLAAEGGNISAVVLSDRPQDSSGSDVWALIDLRLQKWDMSIEGWEELTFDEDISTLIAPEIQARFNVSDDTEIDLELLDLSVNSPSELLVLVSFAGQDDNSNMDIGVQPRRIYAIVSLSYNVGILAISSSKKTQKVPYQSTSSSGAPMHPRMRLLSQGQIIAIQFGDTVVLCAPATEYTDRLELKSSSDRTFGVGVLRNGDENELIILTAATLMKVFVDNDEVAKFNTATGRANIIKSTMTQAILYGSHPENPLHFSFPPDIDEEALMSGAEQLSQAIMESEVGVVRPNHDLHSQMNSRKERLSFLIKFINDNGVLTKMSQRCRQRLATDAEKLYAAHQLWLRHNDSLAAGHKHSVLTEAVYILMNEAGEGHHEDLMRAFFRLRVQDIGALLPHVLEIVRRSSYEITHSLTDTIPQANEIILTILQSSTDYRNYNLGVYGVDLPMIHPWTSQLSVIDIVSELFESTATLVDSSPSEADPANDAKTRAKTQLPELAAALFASYQEQLQWLGSPVAAAEAVNERIRANLDEKFKQARPIILETLRRDGFSEEGFNLAEKYRDFRSLASLCHKETVYPPQDNPYAARIQAYINKFKENFTTELYQWYIEHGELRTMFSQEQNEYLDKFFAAHEYPSVSWIHDLGQGRYGFAAQSLLSEAEHAPELSSKHLMLSIGKLSYLAEVQETESAVDENVLDAFHDGLDFVSVHERLIDELRTALASVRTRQSIDVQVDTITKTKASRLPDRRALYAVFKQLVKRLLQGKALSVEDAADVLSLKDNVPNVEDYITALHLLYHAQVSPEMIEIILQLTNSAYSYLGTVDCRHLEVSGDEFIFTMSARILLNVSSIRSANRCFSWNQIRHTVDATDAELTERFRNTALYAVQQSMMIFNGRHMEGYMLLPQEALPTPTEEEVASRWPGMPADDVFALLRDYERESNDLAALQLEDVVDRVRELAAEEEQWS
ncbi:hypothetical protein PHLCEN_2v10050 [Hermanssonia centrifuga]|uniref:Uncharacterized protein n=1 Tax=Hermanssonia centrifuga TaxID=98765 RepID=A0A2R6NNR7_9APHY|nr:hypothetical protein PHLCEN_2v10050 [Hermanssonia centrifuga]